jgi:hypothetical protein
MRFRRPSFVPDPDGLRAAVGGEADREFRKSQTEHRSWQYWWTFAALTERADLTRANRLHIGGPRRILITARVAGN